MSFRKRFQWVAIAVLAAFAVAGLVRGYAGAEAAATQDPSSLDRRISMLEQRFYSLEQGMSRLQQYVTSQRSTSSSDARGREVDQLNSELQRLQLRLNEVECGLLRLDERTATGSANRKGPESKSTDPCRLNPGLPLRLPSRP